MKKVPDFSKKKFGFYVIVFTVSFIVLNLIEWYTGFPYEHFHSQVTAVAFHIVTFILIFIIFSFISEIVGLFPEQEKDRRTGNRQTDEVER